MTPVPESFFHAPGGRPLSRPRMPWLALAVALLAIAAGIGIALVEGPLQLWLLRAGLGTVLVLAAVALVRLILRAGVSMARQRVIALRELIETPHVPMAVTDAQGVPVAANARFRKLTNWAPGSVAKSLERLFDRDAAALTQFRVLAERIAKGAEVSEEIVCPAAEGLTSWRVQSFHLPGARGMRVWMLVNVTSLRRSVSDLQAERGRLLEFLDMSSSGLFSVDQEGRFLMVNRTLADLLEVDSQTLLSGKPRLHDFLAEPPLDLRPWEALAPSDGAPVQRGVVSLRTQTNRVVRVVLEHEILSEADENEQGPTQIRTRSVTRPLADDRSLLPTPTVQSEPLFQWMFQDAPVGIALVDTDLILIEANGAFCRLARRPLASLQDMPLGEMIRGAQRRYDVEKALARVMVEGGQAGPLEILPAGDGALTLQLFARRLSADDGEIRGLILHAIDISQQKQLETEVAQAQKMDAVGKLAAGVAHDFNNLLTTMRGNAELLLSTLRPGEPSFSEIMQIQNAANRATTMVKHLLAFSRQQTLRPVVVDVTDQISDFSHILRRLIGDRIRLDIHHGRALWPVRVDPVQFDQVLMNLVVNARDAMDNRGTLTIRTDPVVVDDPLQGAGDTIPPGAYVRLQVTDTGSGIPPDILDRIFEPFFTTKDSGKGTGLGLSTVYGIIRQTGGFIRVASVVGQGTTFALYLPRHDAEDRDHKGAEESQGEATGPQPAPLADLTGRETLLLVEDEDGVRDVAERSLAARGYTVIAADCGEAALEALEDMAPAVPDLVISDVMMPEMDGPTLVRTIRQTHPTMKVIFMSGYAEGTIREELGDTEHINFLSKPFELKELAEKIKNVLAS